MQKIIFLNMTIVKKLKKNQRKHIRTAMLGL